MPIKKFLIIFNSKSIRLLNGIHTLLHMLNKWIFFIMLHLIFQQTLLCDIMHFIITSSYMKNYV